MAKPIVLPPLTIKNSPNQSARSGELEHLVVVHDPEGYYKSTISFIMTPAAQVSYHVLLKGDGSEATQLVPWDRKAWSCAAFNSVSDNVSIEGFAGKKYNELGLKVLARIVAFRLKERNLPPTFLPASKVLKGKGFTFHSELGIAGGGHHDPGFDAATKRRFIGYVKKEFKRGNFRKEWGKE
jgi:hypothetical protein